MAEKKEEEGSYTSDMRALLESGAGADVQLVVGGSRLPAHSLVLAARSSVFAAMLRNDMLEANSRRIEITDMQEGVARQMLLFMYTDTTPHLSSMAAELLTAADKYNLPLLKKRSELQMAQDLSVENAVATAAFAILHGCPGLKSTAVNFMVGHPLSLASGGWAQLLRDNAEAAADICSQMARLLPRPPTPASRVADTDDKERWADRLVEAARLGDVDNIRQLLRSEREKLQRQYRAARHSRLQAIISRLMHKRRKNLTNNI